MTLAVHKNRVALGYIFFFIGMSLLGLVIYKWSIPLPKPIAQSESVESSAITDDDEIINVDSDELISESELPESIDEAVENTEGAVENTETPSVKTEDAGESWN